MEIYPKFSRNSLETKLKHTDKQCKSNLPLVTLSTSNKCGEI